MKIYFDMSKLPAGTTPGMICSSVCKMKVEDGEKMFSVDFLDAKDIPRCNSVLRAHGPTDFHEKGLLVFRCHLEEGHPCPHRWEGTADGLGYGEPYKVEWDDKHE